MGLDNRLFRLHQTAQDIQTTSQVKIYEWIRRIPSALGINHLNVAVNADRQRNSGGKYEDFLNLRNYTLGAEMAAIEVDARELYYCLEEQIYSIR